MFLVQSQANVFEPEFVSIENGAQALKHLETLMFNTNSQITELQKSFDEQKNGIQFLLDELNSLVSWYEDIFSNYYYYYYYYYYLLFFKTMKKNKVCNVFNIIFGIVDGNKSATFGCKKTTRNC